MVRIKTKLALLLLTLLASSPAWSDQFFLKRLEIDDCKEGGTCDWLFKYKLGHEAQDWQTLCRDSGEFGWPGSDGFCTGNQLHEANTGEAVTPHLAGKEFDSYPVTLFIEVFEFDFEWFSDRYDLVGSVDIPIDKPGSYKHTLENDEGKVTIFFDILATPSGQRPLAQQIPERRFLDVFERGSDDYDLAAAPAGGDLGWDDFLAEIYQNTANGLPLVDVESWAGVNERRYLGVFREGTEKSAFYGGLRGSVNQEVWQYNNNDGYELVDMDVYTAAYPLHQSVYVQTGVETMYPTEQTMDDLLRTWPEYTADGWRLQDVEVQYISGQRYFRATYRRRSGPTALWITDSREAFETKWRESAAQGLRLIDVEAYPYGERMAYVSVFGGKTNGQAFVSGQTWNQFVDKWIQLSAEGYRLIDIEAYDTIYDVRTLKLAPSPVIAGHDNPRPTVGVVGQLGAESRELTEVTPYAANPPGHRFIRGDANASGKVDMVDAIGILGDLYRGTEKILCDDAADANDDDAADANDDDAADANDDGIIAMPDAISILRFVYAGWAAPVGAPAGATQEDGTPDQLGCLEFVEIASPERTRPQAEPVDEAPNVEVERELLIPAPTRPEATADSPDGPLTPVDEPDDSLDSPLTPVAEPDDSPLEPVTPGMVRGPNLGRVAR